MYMEISKELMGFFESINACERIYDYNHVNDEKKKLIKSFFVKYSVQSDCSVVERLKDGIGIGSEVEMVYVNVYKSKEFVVGARVVRAFRDSTVGEIVEVGKYACVVEFGKDRSTYAYSELRVVKPNSL